MIARRLAGLLTLCLVASGAMVPAPRPALAVAVDVEALADPALDKRARAVARQLRCLVCQNQSIEDSNAELARDLRRLVRERLAAGDDDQAVIAFMVARYGDWVLLDPPMNGRTAALWAAPGLLALVGAVIALGAWRRRNAPVAAAPALDPDEARRLAALMASDDPAPR